MKVPESRDFAKAARRSFSGGGLCIMKYVYCLRSLRESEGRYIGLTSDLEKRLRAHNSGESPHTSKYRPWELILAVRFKDDARAATFERYLKTGSGRAFANKHFW